MNTCLLFDSDGTLVDSELLNCEAMSAELAEWGAQESAQSLVSRYRGVNFRKVFADIELRHELVLPKDFDPLFRERAQQHFELYLQPVKGIADALSQLPNPKCVASNAPMEKLQHVIGLTGLAGFFQQRFYSAYDVGCWKPDPGLFLHAAADMGFPPDRCIVIEDSEVGVQAALSAGMRVVLYNPLNIAMPNAKATVTIDNMEHLPNAIQQLSAS